MRKLYLPAAVNVWRRLPQDGTALLLVFGSLLLFLRMPAIQPFAVDFAPVWAAASSPAHAYDPTVITSAQPLDFHRGLRPFGYPPTALVLFLPFGVLALWTAFASYIVLATSLFILALQRSGSRWWVICAPPFVLCVLIGQMTLLVGALLLLGLASKDWRNRSLLFALAACIKPQLCLFLPLGLIFDRDWRTLLASGLGLALASAIATGLFGAEVWSQWIRSALQVKQTVTTDFPQHLIQFPPYVGVIPAFALVWLGFRQPWVPLRLAVLVGAALLVTPYAMHYELTLLVPALTLPAMLPLAIVVGYFFHYPMAVAPIALSGLAALALVKGRSRERSTESTA